MYAVINYNISVAGFATVAEAEEFADKNLYSYSIVKIEKEVNGSSFQNKLKNGTPVMVHAIDDEFPEERGKIVGCFVVNTELVYKVETPSSRGCEPLELYKWDFEVFDIMASINEAIDEEE